MQLFPFFKSLCIIGLYIERSSHWAFPFCFSIKMTSGGTSTTFWSSSNYHQYHETNYHQFDVNFRENDFTKKYHQQHQNNQYFDYEFHGNNSQEYHHQGYSTQYQQQDQYWNQEINREIDFTEKILSKNKYWIEENNQQQQSPILLHDEPALNAPYAAG